MKDMKGTKDMKLTLGIDPGTRNIGVCIIRDGSVLVERRVIQTPRGMSLESTLAYILIELEELVDYCHMIHAAAVEGVVWFGKVRKIVLPLSHVAGALAGFLWAKGIPTYLVPPAMKKLGGRIPLGRKPSEHEKDAAQLARLAYLAEFASTFFDRRSREAVAKHKISAPKNVPGRVSNDHGQASNERGST